MTHAQSDRSHFFDANGECECGLLGSPDASLPLNMAYVRREALIRHLEPWQQAEARLLLRTLGQVCPEVRVVVLRFFPFPCPELTGEGTCICPSHNDGPPDGVCG